MKKYMFYIKRIFSFLLIIGFISQLESCRGCSNSGKRSIKSTSSKTDKEATLKKNRRSNRKSEGKRIASNKKKRNSRRNRSGKTISKSSTNVTQPVVSTSTTANTSNTGHKTVAELFEDLEKGVFMVYATNGGNRSAQGSGFFINSIGIGITNYHVLEGFSEGYVKTSDGEVYEIIEKFESSTPDNNDYVIFKINNQGKKFKNQKIANSKTKIGEDVFAIGSPKGLENSLTKGSVSQYRENNRIQIDATIDHGSSGGPLFNMKGEVIGITSSGLEGSALNFAVDIRVVPYKKHI